MHVIKEEAAHSPCMAEGKKKTMASSRRRREESPRPEERRASYCRAAPDPRARRGDHAGEADEGGVQRACDAGGRCASIIETTSASGRRRDPGTSLEVWFRRGWMRQRSAKPDGRRLTWRRRRWSTTKKTGDGGLAMSSASMALVRTMLGGTATLQLLPVLAHVHTEGKTTIVRLKIDCKEQNRMEWDSLIFLFVRMER